MSKHYSALALARHALQPDLPWPRAWDSPAPKSSYDVVIVGGGGHGLATAYYLAKNHGITNVAVIEKSYIGSGNVGRNTTLIRSNYMIGGNTAFFEHSLKLWEGLSHELNFNCMVSQRGQIVLAVSPVQMDVFARRGNIMRLNGIDAARAMAGTRRAAAAAEASSSARRLPCQSWALTAGGSGAGRCAGTQRAKTSRPPPASQRACHRSPWRASGWPARPWSRANPVATYWLSVTMSKGPRRCSAARRAAASWKSCAGRLITKLLDHVYEFHTGH